MDLQHFAKENAYLQSNLSEMGLNIGNIGHVDSLTVTKSAEMKDVEVEVKNSQVGVIVTGEAKGDITGGDQVGHDKAGGDIVHSGKVSGDKYAELQDALK